jgi:hypothetical protein
MNAKIVGFVDLAKKVRPLAAGTKVRFYLDDSEFTGYVTLMGDGYVRISSHVEGSDISVVRPVSEVTRY